MDRGEDKSVKKLFVEENDVNEWICIFFLWNEEKKETNNKEK